MAYGGVHEPHLARRPDPRATPLETTCRHHVNHHLRGLAEPAVGVLGEETGLGENSSTLGGGVGGGQRVAAEDEEDLGPHLLEQLLSVPDLELQGVHRLGHEARRLPGKSILCRLIAEQPALQLVDGGWPASLEYAGHHVVRRRITHKTQMIEPGSGRRPDPTRRTHDFDATPVCRTLPYANCARSSLGATKLM